MSTKISELPSATSLTSADEVPIVQTGTTKKATIRQIKSEDYSTTEQRVGTWIDGKPLYQIVIEATAPTVSGNGNYVRTTKAHNIANVDLIWPDKIIDISASSHFILPYNTDGGYFIKGTVTTTNIEIASNATNFNAHTLQCVLNYTKTTDSAS